MNSIEQSQTFTEFCRTEKISKSTLYDMFRRGIGPKVLTIAGTRIKRITAESKQAWRQQMTELAEGKAARIEAERRSAQAAEAGRIAAASPRHVSRQHQHAAVKARDPRRVDQL